MPVALGVIGDGYEMTARGLNDSAQRLRTGKAVPGWAVDFRNYCILQGWEKKESWVPEFTLRSETGLVGLAVRYPDRAARGDAYRALLRGFYRKALEPYRGLPHVTRLQQLCENAEASRQDWDLLEKEVIGPYTGARTLVLRSVEDACGEVILRSIWIARRLFYTSPDEWWEDAEMLLGNLWIGLNMTRLSFMENNEQARAEWGSGHAKPVAHAFLVALETECPPPDWLPGI